MVTAAPDHFDFPHEEEKIIELWRKLDAFQTSLRQSKDRPKYTFYDGPPFATGLPHYGHILAGTIKVGVQPRAPLSSPSPSLLRGVAWGQGYVCVKIDYPFRTERYLPYC